MKGCEIVKAEGNRIVVYQPNETMRLEVRVADETVWLTQAQLCELFGVVKSNVSYHLKNIFASGELDRRATVQEIRTVQFEGGREVTRGVEYFNLDVIISLGFRVNTRLGIQFRQWANAVLRNYMVQGVAVSRKYDALAIEMDRRLALANYANEFPALPISVKGYSKSHDRFLIVDDTVWHIGASLKDAGGALFAMMRMELAPSVILGLLP